MAELASVPTVQGPDTHSAPIMVCPMNAEDPPRCERPQTSKDRLIRDSVSEAKLPAALRSSSSTPQEVSRLQHAAPKLVDPMPQPRASRSNSSSNNDEDSPRAGVDRVREVERIKVLILGVPTPLGRKMRDYLPALSDVSQPAKPQLSLCLSRGATLYLNSIPQTAHAHVRDIHDASLMWRGGSLSTMKWSPMKSWRRLGTTSIRGRMQPMKRSHTTTIAMFKRAPDY